MTQSDLAEAAVTRQATISNAENPRSNMDIDTLFRLLAALNLELVVQPRSAAREDWVERIDWSVLP